MLALLGCDCPTFDEMEVRAVDESVTAEQVATVEAVLAEFAAWTGEVGVCVPSIELAEDVPEPIWLSDDYGAAGQYTGEFQPIQVDVDDGPRGLENTARHELCHALDTQKGYWMHPDLWPAEADRSVISGKRALREDFALACEGGPVDTSLDRALWEQCDREREFSAAQRYLDEVVFPGAPNLLVDQTPVEITRTETSWEPVEVGGTIADVVAYQGRLMALVQGDEFGWLVREFDDDRHTLRRELWIACYSCSFIGFVSSDDGLYVGGMGELFSIDVDAWTATEHAIGYAYPMAVVSGMVYGVGTFDSEVGSWTTEGGWVELPPLRADDPGAGWPDDVWPAGDGLGILHDELGVGSFTDGAWAWIESPEHLRSRTELPDGRAYFAQSGRDFRGWLLGDAGWRLAGDPCDELEAVEWHLGRTALLDEGIFQTSVVRDAVDDPDGDGMASITAWWIEVGQ